MEQVITLTYDKTSIQVPIGTRVEEVVTKRLKLNPATVRYEDNPVIGLRMNNELMAFGAKLMVDAHIEPIRMFSHTGKRKYRQT